ncbi:BTB/POZ domain-containing protein [Aphelenchoides avenae]|nr:BTB/POZ domain-containing protein [Aphelenchus avenae]
MTFTVKRVSSFLASAQSVAESEKVEIDGVQWQIVAKTFIENGTTYLAYYLRGSKAGNWRRWIKADFHIYNTVFGESLSNELRISAPADHYAEWGFDKFISAETLLGTGDFVRNDQLELLLSFWIGTDIFSEESEEHLTNVKLVVQGQSIYLNKDYVSLNSTVFERLFKERAGEKEIALQEQDLAGLLHFLRVIHPQHEKLNAATVKAVYEMARSYGVEYLLKKCKKHVVRSKELSLADKFVLAEELTNNELFNNIVWSLDKPSLKALASNVDVDMQLRDKVVERHLRLLHDVRSPQPMALKKVLFAQETKGEGLLAHMIDNMTKRDIAHLKSAEHKNKLTKKTLTALVDKALSLTP